MQLDTILHWIDLKGFLIVALIFIPLERLFTLHKEQKVLRAWWWNDLIYVFLNKMVIQLGLLLLIFTVGAGLYWLVPDSVRAAIGVQPTWLQTIEVIIIADIGFYLAHRTFHTIPWLWHFHAVHHSIEELDWLAAARVHPIDQIITKGASLLPVFALGFNGTAVGIYGAIYLWHSFVLHANVRLPVGPLRWIIASPEFHHWHHANQPEAYNKNYAGQLALIDVLFGTARMPKGELPSKYGVDDPVPNTYIAHLIYPFGRVWHRIQRKRRAQLKKRVIAESK